VFSELQDSLASLACFSNRYSLGRDKGDGSENFLRIKVPMGRLTLEQLRGVIYLSRRFGREYMEVTDRQDIQLHWIRQEDAPQIFGFMEGLGLTTDKCGQAFPGARYGDVRNIVTCPVAGIERNEIFDVSPDVEKLNRFFTGNLDFQDLPRKLKISVSACSRNCASPQVQDAGFTALRLEGLEGYTLYVGGGIGISPMLAKPLRVFIERERLLDVAVAIAEIFRDCGSRSIKAKARFKWLVEEWGLERLRLEVEKRIGARFEDIPPESFTYAYNSCEHYGVKEQKQKGRFYICIPLLGGILKYDIAEKLAQLAEKHGVDEIRFTNFQNIILPHIDEKSLESLVYSIKSLGLDPFSSTLRFNSIACAGNFCGKAPENPKIRLKEILEHTEAHHGQELADVEFRIFVSGCPNGCARHMVGDIGLQAVHARDGDNLKTCYNIYVGGGLGEKSRLATLLVKAVPAEDVKMVVERLLAHYLAVKHKYASFADFFLSERIEGLRSIISSER